MQASQFAIPSLRNVKFILRRPGAVALHPFKWRLLRLESPRGTEISDDSPMIAACYDAHLNMEKMQDAFAVLRGDMAEGATG